MNEPLQNEHAAERLAIHRGDDAGDHPAAILLELMVRDPETVAELSAIADEREREAFALKALRVGVLALRQARGQVDTDAIRRESERLLESMQARLDEHARSVHGRLTDTLGTYFDPQNGRFQERVDRLIRQDGELEQLLQRQLGDDDSEFRKSLAAHFGEESPLLQWLSPDQSRGLLAAMQATLDEQLANQRDHVLRQFSLDNKEGALSRFITELTDNQGQLSRQLSDRIDELAKQFSFDQEDSALNRLVGNVDRAQKTITREFSLDEENSALSRLKHILEHTNEAIHQHLSLDEENSALSRLRRELSGVLLQQQEQNQKFQEEVKLALREMIARREEAERSTRHGEVFEEMVFQTVQREAQNRGDIATSIGQTTGLIKNNKKGDVLVELGPDSAAPQARIVIEAKEDTSYTLARARDEIEEARKNRGAQIGLFVFSKKTAPANFDPLSRYGSDIFLVWDADDERSDLFLQTGLTLARALCVRGQRHTAIDFKQLDRAVLEVEKQTENLAEIEKWSQTISNNSDKIVKRAGLMRKSLSKQVEILQTNLGDIKASVQEGDGI